METHPLTTSPPRRYRGHPLSCAVAALALIFGVQGTALAQQGTVTGRVIDAESGSPVSGRKAKAAIAWGVSMSPMC